MPGRYAHAEHHLPRAFDCTRRRCPGRVGMQCTGSSYHQSRRDLVPDGMTGEQVDQAVEMILRVQDLRRSCSPLLDAAVADLGKFMDTIRSATPAGV